MSKSQNEKKTKRQKDLKDLMTKIPKALKDPKDLKNSQFSNRGLYVNDDDQDWGSAGMNDVQEDSE